MLRTAARISSRSRPAVLGCATLGLALPAVSTTHSRSISSISSARPGGWSQKPASAFRPRLPRQQQRRALFIRTEPTPNADALKFLPGVEVKPASIKSSFIEYTTPRSTIAPPYPSPLASKLMSVDGVTSVFFGADVITVTKDEDAKWEFLKPEIFALLTEAITTGEKFVTVVNKPHTTAAGDEAAAASAEAGGEVDSLAYDENDSEVVGMIKEILDTRIRPAIRQDGGDLEYLGFEGGRVMLKLVGACRTCSSSTYTLKQSIEKMLCHYIEEVEAVEQVLSPEEEISVKEFANFEEKLKSQGRMGMEKV